MDINCTQQGSAPVHYECRSEIVQAQAPACHANFVLPALLRVNELDKLYVRVRPSGATTNAVVVYTVKFIRGNILQVSFDLQDMRAGIGSTYCREGGQPMYFTGQVYTGGPDPVKK